jgi:hypothetical protein
MPNHGVELIDGIPVILKDGQMYAFQPNAPTGATKIKLGEYNSTTRTAVWHQTDEIKKWLDDYQLNLVPRSRK